MENISIYLNKEIHPENTVLIFDEIQESPNALNSLKYFQEQANQYHITTVGFMDETVKRTRTYSQRVKFSHPALKRCADFGNLYGRLSNVNAIVYLIWRNFKIKSCKKPENQCQEI